jgi:Fe-S cluster assembly ATP-binding protein
MSILTVDNVTLQLNGKKILNDLSIDFWEGHVHAVVGPNGAGKSTLAAAIMGLAGYQGYSGKISFADQPLEGLSIDKRAQLGITLAWQEPARFEGLTVREFVGAARKNSDVESVARSLRQVALEPDDYLARALDKTLSGGERKKIELASILCLKPRVALLDEPDSGIDIESIERIFEAVKLLREQGTTVVLITHSLAVLKQAEHAFLLCGGQLADKGAVEKIAEYFEGKCIPCDHQNLPELKEQEEAQ